MEILTLNIEKLPLKEIKKHVVGKSTNKEYEYEFVRRIIQKDNESFFVLQARDYFLTEFSFSFLDYIATAICKKESANEIQGEYYEFISKKDLKTNTPYYKLTLFKGKRDSTLQTYVSTITTRYFTSIEKKKAKSGENTISIDSFDISRKDFSGSDVIDNPWFTTLVQCEDIDSLNREHQTQQSLCDALELLPERERLIIKLMVMGDSSALEAFEDLEPYIALTAKTPTSEWTKKQKQDAMSLLKGRALEHLKKIIK